MPTLIRSHDNRNKPIVDVNDELLPHTYFNIVRLQPGQSRQQATPGHETCWVVLSGRCDIVVEGVEFGGVGGRASVWEGPADSVYAPPGAMVEARALDGPVEIAVAGGRMEIDSRPFRVTPDEVRMVDVGSVETHARRRIFHILGPAQAGRSGNLLVSELYADEGCWSGYPPHKHDEEQPPKETHFEELYHYRFSPSTGFGAQFAYQPSGERKVHMTQHGDTFLLDAGYHPTVTSPCHKGYIFTVLVGLHGRSLVQRFERQHRWIMDEIPGLQGMRDAFKGDAK